jgi:4-amino-4-deoxy-L-arabinose transferase-like glycosyltransferase
MAVIWIAVILIINSAGEFTYGDDFAYAGPVKTMLETGEMHITDWSSMTLVGHVWIGWLSTSLFGFSFTVLRITELIFGFLGIAGIYFLSKEFFQERIKQIAAVMLFGFSPQFFLFSFAFMTDITFFAFYIWSILFFVKFLKEGKIPYYSIAMLLGLYAFLIRDLALVLPVAFFLAALSKYGYKSRRFYYVILPLLLFVVEYFAYRYWFVNIHGMTHNMDFSKDRMMQMLTDPVFLIKNVGRNFLYSSFYLGFYLSPVLIPVFLLYLKTKGQKIRNSWVFGLLFVSLAAAVFIFVLPSVNDAFEGVLTSHQLLLRYVRVDVHNPSLEITEIFPKWLLALQTAVSVFAGFSIWGLLG